LKAVGFIIKEGLFEWLNWSQEIPELIIVGIAYGEGTAEWWQKRSRDYTPSKDSTRIWGEWPLAEGGEAFLQFIAQELIPFLDATFRTQRNERAMAGLSFGGLFAAYVLLTQPELFSRYIMMSPAFLWENKAIFKHEEVFSRSHDTLHASVYSAVGELDDRETVIAPWQDFFAIVENRHYKDFSLTASNLCSTHSGALENIVWAENLANCISPSEPTVRTWRAWPAHPLARGRESRTNEDRAGISDACELPQDC
jgi:predicted alpha/beta superfamily hydrolase